MHPPGQPPFEKNQLPNQNQSHDPLHPGGELLELLLELLDDGGGGGGNVEGDPVADVGANVEELLELLDELLLDGGVVV